MNLQMFLEFPGILILVGIVLLIISIIIGIIAYKKPSDIKNNNEYFNEETTSMEPIYDASNNINNAPPINFFDTTNTIDNINSNMEQIDYNNYNEAMVVDENNESEINNFNNSAPNITNEVIAPSTPTAYFEETQDSIELENPVINDINNENNMNYVNENGNNIDSVNNMEINTLENVEVNAENNIEYIEEAPIPVVEEAVEEIIQNDQEFNTGVFNVNDFKEQTKIETEEKEITIDDIINEKEQTIAIPEENKEIENKGIENILEENIKPDELTEVVPQEIETPNINPHKPIYGGARPLENVTLDFVESKHDAYTNTEFQPTGNIVTPLTEEMVNQNLNVKKEIKEEQEEDIELL